ncbi:hypothetical protein GCM10010230_09960 [Streptomyces narbonensis]|nr:hypothetical protein GCM10010230_09960 [Streptomyces narbonensis]
MGSQVRITTGPLVTRRISRRPAATSLHWWTLNRVIEASKDPSANGRSSATASTAASSPFGRWALMEADGSTAVTVPPMFSYEPAPAPTLRTVRPSPRALAMKRAMRPSGRR